MEAHDLMKLTEYIRIIYCMNAAEFNKAFGSDGEYLRSKLIESYNNDVSRWLCYLDLNNLTKLNRYLGNRNSYNQ